MPDDIDLFADAPPLKRCGGCGRYFEEQEVKKCRVCGEYFCPECRKTHDCRIKPDAGARAQQPQQEAGAPAPVYAQPVSEPREAPLVREPENPWRPPMQEPEPVPEPAPLVRQPEIPWRPQAQEPEPVPEQESDSAPVYAAPGPEPLNEERTAPVEDAEGAHSPEELQCSECGQYFPKSELSQCHKCGAIVCRDCRKHHKCPPKKKEKKPEDDDFAEPNLAGEKRKKKEKAKKENAEDAYDSVMDFQETKRKRFFWKK